jgi:hypothetical protein
VVTVKNSNMTLVIKSDVLSSYISYVATLGLWKD